MRDLIHPTYLVFLRRDEALHCHVGQRLELMFGAGECGLRALHELVGGDVVLPCPPRDGLERPVADGRVDRDLLESSGKSFGDRVFARGRSGAADIAFSASAAAIVCVVVVGLFVPFTGEHPAAVPAVKESLVQELVGLARDGGLGVAESKLHGLELLPGDHRRMFAGEELPSARDLAGVERVAEDGIDVGEGDRPRERPFRRSRGEAPLVAGLPPDLAHVGHAG